MAAAKLRSKVHLISLWYGPLVIVLVVAKTILPLKHWVLDLCRCQAWSVLKSLQCRLDVAI